MRRSSAIALVPVAIAAAAIAVVLSRGDAGAPRVDRRRADEPPVRPALVVTEREPPPPASTNDPPTAPAVAVPPEPATAPLPPKQDIASAAKSLLEAGLAEEVVKEMVAAVEHMEGIHRSNVQLGTGSWSRHTSEFWLAIWPDLGDMIRRGDVKPEVVAIPPYNWNQPRVPFVPGVTLGRREGEDSVSYSLGMERWRVRFAFTSKSNPKPELFAKILDAARTK